MSLTHRRTVVRPLLRAFCLVSLAFGFWQYASHPAQAADSQASAKPLDPGTLFDQLDTEHKGFLMAEQIPAEKRGGRLPE